MRSTPGTTGPRGPARTPAPAPAPRAVPAAASPPPADPVRDRALFATWSGDPAVVVSSPPGAGKTRLVCGLAEQLTTRAGLDVAVAAQTRAQALDVANRAAVAGAEVSLLGRASGARPLGLAAAVRFARGLRELRGRRQVVVATTARWQHTARVSGLADVILVDEAWQMTYADLGGLGVLARQTVLVGDPGQIDPVVTAATRRWDHWATGPHVPAPQALCAAHPDAVTRLRIPQTWRLGPATTSLLQPFYDDPFTSARPDSVIECDGAALPELTAHPVDTHPDPASPALLAAAAARVRELLAAGQVRTPVGTRELGENDVAVVVAHVAQAAALAAALADHPGVLIGTANQLQGLERHAVVVLHPLAGHRDTPAFGTEPARLCVALSRHRSHASVILDAATPAVLDRALATDPGDTAAELHRHVVDHLPAH